MDPRWKEALLSHSRQLTIELGDKINHEPVREYPAQGSGVCLVHCGPLTLSDLERLRLNSFRTNICTYTSGLVRLSADSVLEIQSTFPELDQELKEKASFFSDQLSQQANHEELKKISCNAWAELNGRLMATA